MSFHYKLQFFVSQALSIFDFKKGNKDRQTDRQSQKINNFAVNLLNLI